MPIYTYQCPKCERAEEVFHPLAALDVEHPCSECGAPRHRILQAARVQADYPGYSCPITGKWIEGKKAHRANLARHGCRVLESGEHEDAARFRQAEDRRLDALAERMAIEGVSALPQAKFQTLAAELEKGGDAQIERRTYTGD